MAKVIVERPRYGSRDRSCAKGYVGELRRALRSPEDERLVAREGMKRRSGGGKWLNENLAPLRRYLDSQVGRPWDRVFSEICANINVNSAVQKHIRDHLADYVVTNAVLRDGVVCFSDGTPLAPSWRWRGLFYICPKSGLLKRVPPPRRRTHLRRRASAPRYVRVGDAMRCILIGGRWHLVTFRPLPLRRNSGAERDVVLDKPVAELSESTARKHYGAAVYAFAARALSKRELKQLPVPMDLWA
jgi:hypothetical protein